MHISADAVAKSGYTRLDYKLCFHITTSAGIVPFPFLSTNRSAEGVPPPGRLLCLDGVHVSGRGEQHGEENGEHLLAVAAAEAAVAIAIIINISF